MVLALPFPAVTIAAAGASFGLRLAGDRLGLRAVTILSIASHSCAAAGGTLRPASAVPYRTSAVGAHRDQPLWHVML